MSPFFADFPGKKEVDPPILDSSIPMAQMIEPHKVDLFSRSTQASGSCRRIFPDAGKYQPSKAFQALSGLL